MKFEVSVGFIVSVSSMEMEVGSGDLVQSQVYLVQRFVLNNHLGHVRSATFGRLECTVPL